MAWPSPVVAGQTITANFTNALLQSISQWGGDVDAQGYALKSVGKLILNANGSIDASAGGVGIKGPIKITNLEDDGLTLVAGDGRTFKLSVKSGAVPKVTTSTQTLSYFSTDLSRFLSFDVTPGQPERIGTGSGRLRFNAVGIDVDSDSTFAGKVTAAALNVTNAVNLTFGTNWQTWTPAFAGAGSGGPMTVTLASIQGANYLRIGPFVIVQFYSSVTLGGTPSNGVSVTLPVVSAGGVAQTLAGFSGGGVASQGRINPNQAAVIVYSATGANFPVPSTMDVGFSGVYRVL
jgi:hypothetical protein